MPDGQDLADITRASLEERGYEVFEVSAVSRKGLRELRFALAEDRHGGPRRRPVGGVHPVVIRPRRGRRRIHHKLRRRRPLPGRGEKPERWSRQTDFTNDEAVGYLADRLDRLGAEVARSSRPAPRRATAWSSAPDEDAVVFDWEPWMSAGAEMLGRRGEDHRLEPPAPRSPAGGRSRQSATRPTRSTAGSTPSRDPFPRHKTSPRIPSWSPGRCSRAGVHNAVAGGVSLVRMRREST